MMATKDQERKALAQIKKIVEGLGEGSYIGTAFEGCFEIAEENIENDWASSAQFYIDKVATLNEQLDAQRRIRQQNEQTIKAKEDTIRRQMEQIKGLEDKIEYAKASAKGAQQETDKALIDLGDKVLEQSAKIKAQEQEIIQLKAKLYDMMTA